MSIKKVYLICFIAMFLPAAQTAHATLIGSTVNITAGNGFGGGDCKNASVVGVAVGGGLELTGANWTGGCIGYYSADIAANLITMSPLEWGNYSVSSFNIQVISGATITGASFLGYTDTFFDPTLSRNDTNLVPLVTFGPEEVNIRWDTGDDSDQFAFNGPLFGAEPFGTAVFSVTTTASPVPEPTSFLLFSTGLGAIALAVWRRRK